MTKILVVDDNSNERNGLCRLLERAGYDVRSAADGMEALEKIQQNENEFDLLLVDVWMPRMNGLELLSQIPEDSRSKALVITGDESPQILLQSLRENAYLFLDKPINPERLLQVVRSTLEAPPGPDSIEVVFAEHNWIELRFPCAVQVIGRIENFVDQLNYNLSPKTKEALKMALHELLMNAVTWGGRLDPNAQAQIDYLRTRKFIMCRIADPVAGSQPAEAESATNGQDHIPAKPVTHPRCSRTDGFGMQLAKTLVDDLVFNEARNAVTIVKYLN